MGPQVVADESTYEQRERRFFFGQRYLASLCCFSLLASVTTFCQSLSPVKPRNGVSKCNCFHFNMQNWRRSSVFCMLHWTFAFCLPSSKDVPFALQCLYLCSACSVSTTNIQSLLQLFQHCPTFISVIFTVCVPPRPNKPRQTFCSNNILA